MRKNPKLMMFVGPMFGGKTTKLLAALDRYRYQKKKIVLFKPMIDKRYSEQKVSTHSGLTMNATLVKTGEELYNKFLEIDNEDGVDIIAVDELFMIPGSADALLKIYKENSKSILISTIQLNSVGGVMPEVGDVMPWATQITVCPAVCSMCDADAHFTYKKSNQEHTGIEVGGSELYESLCHHHFKLKKGFDTNI